MSAPSPADSSPRPGAPVPALSLPAVPAPRAAPGAPGAGARLALFRSGGHLCGIAAAFCKQFVHLEAVTPVPLGPPHLIGVTQLRGRILPVFDSAALLGLLPATPAARAMDGALPADAPGMPALVVTASGLDSTLAALAVTEIVGFEPPTPAAAPGGRPLWRGEEVLVLDLGTAVLAASPAVAAASPVAAARPPAAGSPRPQEEGPP